MKKLTAFAAQNKSFTLFSFLASLVLLAAVFAPLIATHSPYQAVLSDALRPPTLQHWFGTDALGRDMYSRVIFGARTSVSSTLALVAVVFVVGTSLGIVSGYYGGAADTVIMRVADAMIAFPDLILAIAIVGILGPNMSNAILAIAVVSWTKYARLSRSLVMKIRNCDYIAAARVTGSKSRRVLLSYMLPNVLPIMVITAATDIGTIMLALASLSFLGFGIQPPTPEWGYMLSEGRQYFQSCPWLLYYPGLAIFVVVVIFNLMGDSLRDVLDPKTEQVVAGIRETTVTELKI
jgi:peptide/nickel transport system permease protein/nickel transport system permease protein